MGKVRRARCHSPAEGERRAEAQTLSPRRLVCHEIKQGSTRAALSSHIVTPRICLRADSLRDLFQWVVPALPCLLGAPSYLPPPDPGQSLWHWGMTGALMGWWRGRGKARAEVATRPVKVRLSMSIADAPTLRRQR